MSEVVLRFALRCDRTAPQRMRATLDRFDGIGSIRDDAKLVATELINDAVWHPGSTSGDLIMVSVRLSGDQLMISVHSPDHSEENPRSPPNDDLEQCALGMLMVRRIARRWGTERAEGRVVWAELPVASG